MDCSENHVTSIYTAVQVSERWMCLAHSVIVCALVFLTGAPALAQAPRQPDEFRPGDAATEPAPLEFDRDDPLPEGEAAGSGDVIDELRVRGNRRVEKDSVLGQMRTTVGAEIDPARISEDIRRVYKLGYFEDIKVDATRTADDKVVLTIIVEEKPAISQIRYEGNDELDVEDIQDVVNLRPNSVLSIADVKANAEKIRELYSEKGFFLADVDYEIEIDPRTPELATVVFNIREYAKVQVKRVTFLGNENIPDEELLNIMATRPGDWSSFLTSFGEFKEVAFQQDIQRITAYYYDQGYVQVKVERPIVRLSRDKSSMFITIKLTEGDQYDVGEVDVTGDFIVDKEELLEMASIAETEDGTFKFGTMRSDLEKIRTLYQDQGYAYVNVNPLTQIREEDQAVDVTYDIQKGSKVYFGRIEVVGNTKTRDLVIRRELRIEEGQLYSNTAIEQSKIRVQRLGFFEQVNITTQRSDRDDVINVQVEVTERPTGTFQVGAGFSSLESFILNAQVSQNNLFGRGQSLAFQAQVSSIRTLFNISFNEPYLFDSRWSSGVELYNFDILFQDFARRSRGGNLTFGYPISDLELFSPIFTARQEMRASLTYKLEDVELRPGGRSGRNSRQVGNLFRGGLTSSVRFGLSFDSRDNRLFPTTGNFSTARVEFSDDNLTGSQVEFLKYDFESRFYFPIFWEFVLRLNAQIGYVQSTDPRKPVPLFERYFVGGPTTVRGFDRSSLGPSLTVPSNSNDPATSGFEFNIGGNKVLILRTEVEFPILTAIGIKGVVFADAGNAFDNGQGYSLALDIFSDDDNDYDDVLRTSVGFGFRWFSPIGPLRFEWGIPLARLRNEKPLVFDFSIGNAF